MAGKEATLWLKIKTAGEESLSRISDGLETVGKIGAIAFGVLSAVVVKAIGDFRQQEEATNALTQSMVNNGVYSSKLKQEYLEQASALQKLTTFGDEQIIAAQAAVQSQIGEMKVTEPLTRAILDLATAKKMDLASAAEMVGKSIGTSTNALARQGIEVDANATKAEKLSQVISGLNSKFGGQAEAAAQGLGGLKQLENTVSDLFETLGERLVPVISIFSQSLNKLAGDAGNTNQIIDAMVSVFNFTAKVISTLTQGAMTLGDTIGIVLVGSFQAVSEAMSGNFTNAKNIAVQAMDSIGEVVATRTQASADTIAAIDAAAVERKNQDLLKEEENLNSSIARKKEIQALNAETEAVKEMERKVAQQEFDLAFTAASEEQKIALMAQAQQKQFDQATTNDQKIAALRGKSALLELQQIAATNKAKEELEMKTWQARAGIASFAANAITNVMGKESKAALLAQKVAGVSQALVATNVAAAQALTAAPPPIGPALAAFVTGLGYANMAAIAGVQLAEGGIVKARPGGIQATIGEGGQDEAVIPLDKMGAMGGITINFHVGAMMGNQDEAYKFAKVVDQELLNLRRNNESVAFDSGVT
ncbi:MAG TPA: hypothetical protein VJN02_03975 [Gammaproteobacteria bacterium]|nr:hypothetical protein [Gammaproteobacteria bacterium]